MLSIEANKKRIEVISKLNEIINKLNANNLKYSPLLIMTISHFLKVINEYFIKSEIRKSDLEGFAFGIFRLVTDDGGFEDSQIGKELLDLGKEIRELSLQI